MFAWCSPCLADFGAHRDPAKAALFWGVIGVGAIVFCIVLFLILGAAGWEPRRAAKVAVITVLLGLGLFFLTGGWVALVYILKFV